MDDSKTENGNLKAMAHEIESAKQQPPSISHVEAGEVEDAYKLSLRTILALICMGISWGCVTMGNIGPSTTYHYVVDDLGGAEMESWIANASLVPLIGLQPIWGSLADRFGKKWFIVAGGVLGISGSIAAATADNTGTVIGAQVVNGIGASMILLVIPAGLEVVAAQRRGLAQGIMGTINGVMTILSLLVSGAFSKMSGDGWRWVYYFNAIFFGSSSVLMSGLYRPPPTRLFREFSIAEMLKSIDFVGITLLLASVIGLVMSLTWGGHTYPWDSSRVVALLVAGSGLLVAFCIYEWVGRSDGLVDHRFLESRNFLLILSVTFLDGLLLYGLNAFIPSEAAVLFNADPLMIGVYLLPLNVSVIFGIVGSTYVLSALKRYRLLLMLAILLMALFCGLLALVTPSRLAMMLVFTGLIGLGVGVTTTIPVIILSYAVPSHMIGTAGTLFASCRALGGVTGITIFTTIETSYQNGHLFGAVVAAVAEAGLSDAAAIRFATTFEDGDNTASLENIADVTLDIIAAADDASQMVSMKAFRFIWIANAAFAVVTAIFAMFLEAVDHKMTKHVETPLEPSKHAERIKVNNEVRN